MKQNKAFHTYENEAFSNQAIDHYTSSQQGQQQQPNPSAAVASVSSSNGSNNHTTTQLKADRSATESPFPDPSSKAGKFREQSEHFALALLILHNLS